VLQRATLSTKRTRVRTPRQIHALLSAVRGRLPDEVEEGRAHVKDAREAQPVKDRRQETKVTVLPVIWGKVSSCCRPTKRLRVPLSQISVSSLAERKRRADAVYQGHGKIVTPEKRIRAHRTVEDVLNLKSEDFGRLQVPLGQASSGPRTRRIPVRQVSQPIAVSPLVLRDGPATRGVLFRRTWALRVGLSIDDRGLGTPHLVEGTLDLVVHFALGLCFRGGEMSLGGLHVRHRLAVHVCQNGKVVATPDERHVSIAGRRVQPPRQHFMHSAYSIVARAMPPELLPEPAFDFRKLLALAATVNASGRNMRYNSLLKEHDAAE
jgi:hypothetical protein